MGRWRLKEKGGGERMVRVGIAGIGTYVPTGRMSSEEIAHRTKGVWTKEGIENKLGILEKSIPGEEDGTQEMAVRAARMALEDAGVSPMEVDVIISVGEEWKEYLLTTTAIYIQEQLGATRAWGIDLNNRCASTVTALKMAKDMLVADPDVKTVLIAGGYRNGDLIDYEDKGMVVMYNLAAGAGALVLKKNHPRNELLGTHLVSEGSLSRASGLEIGGILNPVTKDNVHEVYHSLRVMEPEKLRSVLKAVSIPNWIECVDEALRKSNLTRGDLDYMAMLHIARSKRKEMLEEFGLGEHQSIYFDRMGHMGQVDQILSLKLALESGAVKDGTVLSMLAAGIGFIWAANIVRWGPVVE